MLQRRMVGDIWDVMPMLVNFWMEVHDISIYFVGLLSVVVNGGSDNFGAFGAFIFATEIP